MSRFLKQSLMPEEKVIREGEFHWIYSMTSLFILCAFSACGWGLQFLIANAASLTGSPIVANTVTGVGRWPFYIGMGLGLAVFFWRWIVKSTTEIVLTNKRFLYKRGVFSVRTEKMDAREVNYCEIRQSLLGNLMDYGRIYVYTMTLDDSNIFLPDIAKPHVFTSLIEQVKKGGGAMPDRSARIQAEAAAMMREKNVQGDQ